MFIKNEKATGLIGQEKNVDEASKMLGRPVAKKLALSIAMLSGTLFSAQLLADVPVASSVTGEIESIKLDSPGDHWSGGSMVVGGQNIIIPKNMLLDLPANRVTLEQLYTDAPAACFTLAETGLSKVDACNASVSGAIATIAANRLSTGQVVAGDVLIEKAVESVTGQVTYINHDEGYFRVNGVLNSTTAGVMVRLNDPTGRHTVQPDTGAGCEVGAPNCSPDSRFALDSDNYTNTFVGGFPSCIPSTVPRLVPTALTSTLTTSKATSLGLNKTITPVNAAWNGSDDALCPSINRPGVGLVSGDSRRFAPIKLGDSITVEGNYEEINGFRFLSAHTSKVSSMLVTSTTDAIMPDYMEFDEAFIDAPGFQNQRTRSLFIGFVTKAPADIMIWSIHYDPTTNSPHEFPLASTTGCDIASGAAGQCTAAGIPGLAGAGNIFRIKHDVDFILDATLPGKVKPTLNPCAHLNADTRFNSAVGNTVCSPNTAGAGVGMDGTFAEQFGILSPMPHEIQARTGRKFADIKAGSRMISKDVNGQSATWGQYLMPFGIGLGGVDIPNFLEIDPNKLNTPFSFTGLPWNLDRRLSPGGCGPRNSAGALITPCGAVKQPLTPFPSEDVDPRLLEATLPHGPLAVGAYTSVALTDVSDRILSFVNASAARTFGNGVGVNAAGNFTKVDVLDWMTTPMTLAAVSDTASSVLACTIGGASGAGGAVIPNVAPIAVNDAVAVNEDTVLAINPLANDTGPSPLSLLSITQPANGIVVKTGNSVSYTPKLNYNNTLATADSFSYVVTDGKNSSTAIVSILVNPINDNPVAVADAPAGSVNAGATLVVDALFNDSDVDSDALTIATVGTPTLGTVSIVSNKLTYVANVGTFGGTDTFTYSISDGKGGTASSTVTVKVVGNLADTVTFTNAKLTTTKFIIVLSQTLALNGTSSVPGKTVSVYAGSTCPAVGAAGAIATATVQASGAWAVTTGDIKGNTAVNAVGKPLVACSSGLGFATRVVN
ncbi:MAG: cadherin-like domain-containing protein [Methylococcales bacterium]|nr:cadherin-like domain-containing protein [Methylococcales bacterium]